MDATEPFAADGSQNGFPHKNAVARGVWRGTRLDPVRWWAATAAEESLGSFFVTALPSHLDFVNSCRMNVFPAPTLHRTTSDRIRFPSAVPAFLPFADQHTEKILLEAAVRSSSPNKSNKNPGSMSLEFSPVAHQQQQQHEHHYSPIKRPPGSAWTPTRDECCAISRKSKVAKIAPQNSPGATFVSSTTRTPTHEACVPIQKPTLEAVSRIVLDNLNKHDQVQQQKKSLPVDLCHQKWTSRFQHFLRSRGFLGSLLIRGLPPTSPEETSKKHYGGMGTAATITTTSTKKSSWSLSQLDEHLRYILINESRALKLQVVRELVLDTHVDDDTIPYDQHGTFSRQVLRAWQIWNKEIMYQVKRPHERLDWLIAFTSTLNEYDMWMYDCPHPEPGDYTVEFIPIMVNSLGATWKRLFQKVQQNPKAWPLEWDVEYTKPGVLELLSQFHEKIHVDHAHANLGSFDYGL